MWLLTWLQQRIGFIAGLERGDFGGAAAGIWRWNVGVATGVTAMAGIALAATLVISARRGSLKSPWSRRKRKHALTLQKWNCLLSPEGKIRDEAKFLKKVRSGGIDPRIRPVVWPFLLGVYDLNSTEVERERIKSQNSRKYNKLRLRCRQLNLNDEVSKQLNSDETSAITLDEEDTLEEAKSLGNADALAEEADTQYETKTVGKSETLEDEAKTLEADPETIEDAKTLGKAEPVEEEAETLEAKTLQLGEETSDESNTLGKGETHEEDKIVKLGETVEEVKTLEREETSDEEEQSCITGANSESSEDEGETQKKSRRATENYSTWQRIIRLDALRANADWIAYSPGQAAVSNETAAQMAAAAGLQDYSHLEPCRVLHASRLVSILEAYALLDPEIGYCQGMSDLLSPIIAVVDDDSEAFWCFAGFMRKARHNFRLDEVGIRRQLSLVAKIIKQRDGQLYRHLEKLQAEDCFFVYRMVVVLLRREMSFEQTLCLWEVMWADQAAVRAGVGKSGWDRIRQRAPPTEDLLLYAIAACVLQRRKMIIEKYSSMDEILRECNSMAGRLDFWKLLNDAHDLVVALHDKV